MKLTNCIGLLFFCIFFISCVSDDSKMEEGKDATIRLQVKSENPSDGKTRGTTLFSDESINNVHVLVYNSSHELIGHGYSTGSTITVNTRSGNGYTIYAIANTGNADLFDAPVASTETKLKAMMTEAISNLDGTKINGESLLMSGVLSNQTVTSGSSSISNFPVSRLAAKISLTIEAEATSGITVTGYRICNLPDKSYLIADDSNDAVTTNGTWFNTSQISGSAVSAEFYMYENRRGTGAATGQKEKALYAPANATYVEIYAKSSTLNATYKIYLGADNYQDYNIRRNGSYTYAIKLNGPGEADTRVTHTGFSLNTGGGAGTGNMNFISEPANCYILSPGSTITIPVNIKGNGDATTSGGLSVTHSAISVAVLWQTASGLISNISNVFNGMVNVTASSSSGNAVIAAYSGANGTGDVLWSWHMWITNYNPEMSNDVINNNIWMRYNLGATTLPDGINTFKTCGGLLYQWGRKDPFPGSNTAGTNVAPIEIFNYTIPAYTGLPVQDVVADPYVKLADVSIAPISYTNQLDYSIKYPLLFLSNWAGSTATTDATTAVSGGIDSWGGEYKQSKTIYDPCPAGWRVPSGKQRSTEWNSPWSTWTSNNSTLDTNTSYAIWEDLGLYPIVGWRNISGEFYYVGTYSYCWSATIYDFRAYSLLIYSPTMNSSNSNSRAYGFSIRCIKE